MTFRSNALINNTPLEDRRGDLGLVVKHEELCCPLPGPPFSKTRGVFAHIEKLQHQTIGVLDTYHSQAGHAVAQACGLMGKRCVNYYPEFKHEPGWRAPQERAKNLGAELVGLKAGRSSILFHQAKKDLLSRDPEAYMMPNALKLPEMVTETAAEAYETYKRLQYWNGTPSTFLIAISSGTIAAGVIRGVMSRWKAAGATAPEPHFILHMGYDRSEEAVLSYVQEQSGLSDAGITLINEGYGYKDVARSGMTPDWPCNAHYDLKAFRWWMTNGRGRYGEAVLWNIG